MSLLKLEIRRILKTKITYVLLLLALFFSFVMAYLPTTFSHYTYIDENGNEVEVSGIDAIRYTKEVQADTAGIVTTEKIRSAIDDYQKCLSKYGVNESYELPEGVYGAEIFPYAPLLHGVKEAFADSETGVAASIMEINTEELDDFYKVCEERLAALMKLEQKEYPEAQETANALYDKVETPYRFYPGYSTDAMDYQILLMFLIMLFCVVISAPVFTSDYQTGADDILRCTKYGRTRLAAAKITSALLISGITFSVCIFIYIIVSNCLFGWECTKTSIQMLYSIVNMANMNIGQLQIFIAISGLFSVLATVSFTLFLSSKVKNVVTSLGAALLFCILPMVVYMALPDEISPWIYGILPSGGAGLQTSMLSTVVDFIFLNIGDIAMWLPYVMIGAYIVEIPLFTILAVRSYNTRNMK